MAERNFWFVTRPVRDPEYHEDALQALQKATNNFTLVWKGNRPLHRQYEQCLVDAQMKQNNISRDGSGGRTWAAMLKTYNYIYEDSNGVLHPTKVAEEILKGNKIRQNIQKQVLTLQIPNSYFLSSAFRPKYASGYSIQPIIFLIRLANSPELKKYITKKEIILFAMTAKRDQDLNQQIQKIIQYRKADDGTKKKIEAEIFSNNGDISRVDSRKDFSKYTDVATTFTILCRFTDYALADHENGGLKGINDPKAWNNFEQFCTRYPFNNRINVDPLLYTLNAGLDVDTYKAQYGVNARPASNAKKKAIKVQRLLSKYPQPEDLDFSELTKILDNEFPSNQAQKIAEDIKSHKINIPSGSFLDLYLHEPDNLEFERKTARVLKGLGLTTIMHPDPTTAFNNANENIDILVIALNNTIVLVDAKNYAKHFNLSASLRNVMANSYLAGYKNFKGLDPKYYCYVTASACSNEKNLLKINELAKKNSNLNVHGMMISASALYLLLRYCLENKISDEQKEKLFLKLFNDKAYQNIFMVAKALDLPLDKVSSINL